MEKDARRQFSVSVRTDGTDAIVSAVGELDIATALQLKRALEDPEVRASERVYLDLRELSFSDAAGLRVIDEASRALRHRLTVFGSAPPVRRLFEVTHLDRLMLREGETAPASDVPASNLAYVRYLWEGFRTGGTPQVREMVPPDAEWRPPDHRGRALRGARGLAEFWASDGCAGHVPTSFSGLGDDVLVSSCREDRSEVWTLFRFDGRRLLGAACFRRRAEAIAAHRLRKAS